MYSDTTGTVLPAYLAGSANATAADEHRGSLSLTAHRQCAGLNCGLHAAHDALAWQERTRTTRMS